MRELKLSFVFMLRRIRFIVGIAACSLAGIFLLQAYWLFNSYQLHAEAFDKKIMNIVQALQRHYILADMQQLEMPTSGLKLNEGEHELKFLQSLDTLGIPGAAGKGDSTKKLAFSVVSTLETDTKGDTLNESKQLMDSTKRFKRTLFIGGKNAKNHIVKLTSKEQFDHFLDQPYSQTEFQHLERSLHAQVDSLMQVNEIHVPFALRLKDAMHDESTYVADSTLFHQLTPKVPAVKMGMLRPFYLDLSLNNDLLFIIKKMQWVLLSSIFIIAITFGAYFYMLKTIFQQKRLSDIKNDFFNNMTHEFKTPIATVSLAVEALKQVEVRRNPNQMQEYLDISQHELKRITFMVEKVLRTAAFERSEVPFNYRPTDLKMWIEESVKPLKLLLEQKEAKLALQIQENLPLIWIDQDHMANVLYNLVDNSLKYVRSQPAIFISCRTIGKGQVQLEVKDNGIGIPLAYQDKIFENFFRVPTGNVHNNKGFGLGLGYAAEVVKKHDGHIQVDSMPNKGSTFTITLPIKS